VEDHLLDRVLPAAYVARPGQAQSCYTVEQAQHWLGFIAHKLNQDATRDLVWWLIPQWKPPWPRILVTSLVFGVVWGVVFGFVGKLLEGVGGGPVPGLGGTLVIGLVGGLLGGLVLGLLVGLVVEFPGRPPQQVGRLNWSRVFTWNTFGVGLVLGLMCGLVFGVVTGHVFGVVTGLVFGLGSGLALLLLIGFGGGLVEGLTCPAADAISPIDPITCWRRDRRFTLAVGLGAALAVGLGGALVVGFGAGFVFGVVCGFGFLLVAGPLVGLTMSTTWSTALAFAQLRCVGEGPFRMLHFLEDARKRHVLRITGPVYQFRHGRLQARLARAFEEQLGAEGDHHAPTGSIHIDSSRPTATRSHRDQQVTPS
jgi:MFS family permease